MTKKRIVLDRFCNAVLNWVLVERTHYNVAIAGPFSSITLLEGTA